MLFRQSFAMIISESQKQRTAPRIKNSAPPKKLQSTPYAIEPLFKIYLGIKKKTTIQFQKIYIFISTPVQRLNALLLWYFSCLGKSEIYDYFTHIYIYIKQYIEYYIYTTYMHMYIINIYLYLMLPYFRETYLFNIYYLPKNS